MEARPHSQVPRDIVIQKGPIASLGKHTLGIKIDHGDGEDAGACFSLQLAPHSNRDLHSDLLLPFPYSLSPPSLNHRTPLRETKRKKERKEKKNTLTNDILPRCDGNVGPPPETRVRAGGEEFEFGALVRGHLDGVKAVESGGAVGELEVGVVRVPVRFDGFAVRG